MKLYVCIAVVVRYFVDFLVILGTNRICGVPLKIYRGLGASLVGAAYTAGCMMASFDFLGNTVWHVVSLLVISMLAFDWDDQFWKRCAIFSLLNLSMTALGAFDHGAWGVIFSLGVVAVICALAFRSGGGGGYVPVELNRCGKKIEVIALRDTGNSLTDPLTGRPVLVIGPDTANYLTGLTRAQLQNPIGSLGAIPGLRLIPYRTVGQSSAFMLGLRFQDLKIGKWRGNALVAFAPEGLDINGKYQALAGGYV